MADVLRTLRGREELLAASGDDPFVRWECAQSLLTTAWSFGRALAFLRHNEFRAATFLIVIGPAGDADRLLGALVAAGIDDRVSGVSVDRPLLPVAAKHFRLGPGGDWDWMWTLEPPPAQRGESLVVELDDRTDAAELLRLNEIGSPTAESRPGEGVTELWLGIREAGRIVAAGAMHRSGAGAPELAGIVTHPDARGRGLGGAVTTALTRTAIDHDGVCTLGMYSANDVARRLYHRLGYRTAHAWASRRFVSNG